MRTVSIVGLALWMALAIACKKDPPASATKATREDCTRAGEHIADLIVADYRAKPDAFWDVYTREPGESGIPPEVTKAEFAAWLASPPGATFLAQRRGNVLAATRQAVDGCVEHGSKALVSCLLAARTQADVEACDAKNKPM